MNYYREAEDMIEFIGGTHEVLINWHWCNDLASEELANGFVKWLEERGFEHRGTYFKDDLWSVRYRHAETMRKDDEVFSATIKNLLADDEEEIKLEYKNFAKRIPHSGFFLIFQKDTGELLGGINFFPAGNHSNYHQVIFYSNDLQEEFDSNFTIHEIQLEQDFGKDMNDQAVGLWNKWNNYEL